MDVGLNLKGTHLLITGGAGLIGSKVVQAFLAAGAHVSSLDIAYPKAPKLDTTSSLLEHHADTTDEASVQAAFAHAEGTFGTVSVCVALAALDLSVLGQHKSATTLTAEEFRRTLDVNVTGTFLTAREWLRRLEQRTKLPGELAALENVGLIIVGSEAGRFGVTGNADYATSKSAVQVGLLRSLSSDAPRIWRGARVNAVAPGPVDTTRFKEECEADPEQYYRECQCTVPHCRPVPPEDVAKTIVVLASENLSGSVHGQLIPIDNGKAGRLVWSEVEGKGRREETGRL